MRVKIGVRITCGVGVVTYRIKLGLGRLPARAGVRVRVQVLGPKFGLWQVLAHLHPCMHSSCLLESSLPRSLLLLLLRCGWAVRNYLHTCLAHPHLETRLVLRFGRCDEKEMRCEDASRAGAGSRGPRAGRSISGHTVIRLYIQPLPCFSECSSDHHLPN